MARAWSLGILLVTLTILAALGDMSVAPALGRLVPTAASVFSHPTCNDHNCLQVSLPRWPWDRTHWRSLRRGQSL